MGLHPLLSVLCFPLDECEWVVALGTLRKIEFDNFVEHFGAERRAKILLVSGLSTYFTLDFIAFFVFLGWRLGFDDIGGRRLGRGAGVLSQCGDFFECGFQLRFELCNSLGLL